MFSAVSGERKRKGKAREYRRVKERRTGEGLRTKFTNVIAPLGEERGGRIPN